MSADDVKGMPDVEQGPHMGRDHATCFPRAVNTCTILTSDSVTYNVEKQMRRSTLRRLSTAGEEKDGNRRTTWGQPRVAKGSSGVDPRSSRNGEKRVVVLLPRGFKSDEERLIDT